MSSTREVASRLIEDWVANHYNRPNHLHPLIDAIDAALRAHEQAVRAEERERAAGIVLRRESIYAEDIAASIRCDDTAAERNDDGAS